VGKEDWENLAFELLELCWGEIANRQRVLGAGEVFGKVIRPSCLSGQSASGNYPCGVVAFGAEDLELCSLGTTRGFITPKGLVCFVSGCGRDNLNGDAVSMCPQNLGANPATL
jgi:hypothetical protein